MRAVSVLLFSSSLLLTASSTDSLFDGPFPAFNSSIFQVVDGIQRKTVGEYGTMEYIATFSKDGKDISIWMDIPLYVTDPNASAELIVNFWPEIVRGRMEKMELYPKEAFHPIKVHTRAGEKKSI